MAEEENTREQQEKEVCIITHTHTVTGLFLSNTSNIIGSTGRGEAKCRREAATVEED